MLTAYQILFLCTTVLVACFIYPICFYYIYQFWYHRYHTVLIKRHNRLSFHNIFFLTSCGIVVLIRYSVRAFDITINNLFLHLLYEFIIHFIQCGTLYLPFLRFWHLWYDTNYVSACVSYRWHQIICKQSRTNVTKTNTNNNNNTNYNTNRRSKVKKYSYDSANSNSRKSSVGTITSDNNPKSNKTIKKLNIDPIWFITHKSTLGYDRYTTKYCYLWLVICALIIAGLIEIGESQSGSNHGSDEGLQVFAVIIAVCIYILPVVLLCCLIVFM